MATLVLTSVGTLVGGPIGGAIGAIVGQTIDRAVLKPKGRQGPRLGDLTVQTSAYGSPIPAVWGRMRVAGTVIWSTDLREERTRTGGGKGRPSVTNYSYTASFAVLLSARPVLRVRRIWADGNLMRGAAGDFKVATRFRLHRGGEDQRPDPLIASAEGASLAPAHRGQAYAVFEDLDLGPYGNRIPSLTFEVEADEGPVPVAAIMRAASGMAVESAAVIDGFATGGDSVRGMAETLAPVAPLRLVEREGGARLSDASPPAAVVPRALIAAGAVTLETLPADAMPGEMAIHYHEPERDYQAGLQGARRAGAGGRTERVELPATLPAAAAKGLAERALDRLWAGRRRARVTLPWGAMGIVPGDRVLLPEIAGAWRVAGSTLEEMRLSLMLVADRGGRLPPPEASPGRGVGAADHEVGETRIAILDLPPLDESRPAAPTLHVAAAGTGAGWRSAALLASVDGGASYAPAGPTAAPAVIGVAAGVLGSGGAATLDLENVVEVVLVEPGMMLNDVDDRALFAGGNLAVLGEELIAFGRAMPLGGGRWRLSRLLRGRCGTEAGIGGHAAGERFVMVERDALAPVTVPAERIGGRLDVIAVGAGDDADGVRAAWAIEGWSIRPLSPVHLRASHEPGGLRVTWTRRSRFGWGWGEVEPAIGEESERYRIELLDATGTIVRAQETDAPHWSDADGGTGGASRIRVRQLGDHGVSPGAELALPSMNGRTL